ncbi:cytochrome P450 [Kitasatospora purpeofusca]|uniref:cytochrome P450 n=1 Tax=Kitasatospora purpeofusca TaxID=67352 RepID=UPI002A59BAD6|nr:cytochrome P450 [Kitasatospora purpeofusca]MDY0812017.1 cytochrome P450 [Kitasatospora purpeofusca]
MSITESTEAPATCPVRFPAARENPVAPPGAYRPEGHDGGPIEVDLAYGGRAWLVTRHADVRALFGNHRLSSDATVEGYPQIPLAYGRQRPGVFLSMDPPEHERVRNLLSREFSAAAVAARRPAVEQLVDRLLDRFTADGRRSGDLVKEFADLLPCYVSGYLYGVTDDYEGFVRQCINARATHDGSLAKRLVAGERMRRFLSELLDARDREPGDDLLSRLLANARTAGLGRDDVVGVATLLLAASLDATAAVTSMTVLAVLREPALTERLRTDPRRWAAAAVEESLRYWTVIQHGPVRAVTEDIELAGRTLRKGEFVILHLHSANWDRAVFRHPEQFDIDRPTNPHLSFGHGIHRCLGGGLGALEATIALERIFTALPDLRLDVAEDDLAYRHDDLVYGVRGLPVAW